MIIALFDACIDGPHLDLGCDRRVLRTFAIDFDPPAKVREFAASRAKELMNSETYRRARWIEPVALLCEGGGAEPGDHERRHKIAYFHFEISFASLASVFKSGVRESGSRPNKFPSANAGSALSRR